MRILILILILLVYAMTPRMLDVQYCTGLATSSSVIAETVRLHACMGQI